ncbi:unnamed protein product [Discosporangium mesarthrocarpum]
MPKGALLLSHTDLNLNPARYLQVCEGTRQDVTHVSLQMVPYPWWNPVQAPLHPNVTFPPVLRGVSTRRDSEGNAVLITRLLDANLRKGGGNRPVFLDMQAVDESEIGPGGSYRGYTLLPWGLVYRVLPGMDTAETEAWHDESLGQLRRLQGCMRPSPADIYPPGSWEFAASSVFWDAHYQMGLFLLSYAIQVWRPRELLSGQRGRVLPGLKAAASLLGETLEAVDAHGTLSSLKGDLVKNTALSYIRLQGALELGLLEQRALRAPTAAAEEAEHQRARTLEEEEEDNRLLTLHMLERFLRDNSGDRDESSFARIYARLREVTSTSPAQGK